MISENGHIASWILDKVLESENENLMCTYIPSMWFTNSLWFYNSHWMAIRLRLLECLNCWQKANVYFFFFITSFTLLFTLPPVDVMKVFSLVTSFIYYLSQFMYFVTCNINYFFSQWQPLNSSVFSSYSCQKL